MDSVDLRLYTTRESIGSTSATYYQDPYNFIVVFKKYITNSVILLILKNKDFNPPFTGVALGGHVRFYTPPAQRTVPNQWNGKKDVESPTLIKRVYTPVFVDAQSQLLHFVIRVYERCDDFCDGGKCSRFLAALPINSEVSCQIVPGKLAYSRSLFTFKEERFPVKKVAFIAGGTGITLFYRIITSILHDIGDNTRIVLLFSVRNTNEIILHQSFKLLQSDKLVVVYFVSRYKLGEEIKDPDIHIGYVSQEVVEREVKDSCHAFICGPKPFNKYINELLLLTGYPADRITSI